jgi:hypothetical protein
VDVVGHQAIAEHAQAAAAAPLGEQLTVGVAIGIVKKNGLAVVPPLRNVVRDTGRNHARDAWHGGFQGSIVAGRGRGTVTRFSQAVVRRWIGI